MCCVLCGVGVGVQFKELEEQEAEINGKARDFTPFQALRAFVFCVPRSWWMCCECGRLRVEEEELGEREARDHARQKAEEFAAKEAEDKKKKEEEEGGSSSEDEDDKKDKPAAASTTEDAGGGSKKGSAADAADTKPKSAVVVTVDGVVAARVDDDALRLNKGDKKEKEEAEGGPKRGFRTVFYANGNCAAAVW